MSHLHGSAYICQASRLTPILPHNGESRDPLRVQNLLCAATQPCNLARHTATQSTCELPAASGHPEDHGQQRPMLRRNTTLSPRPGTGATPETAREVSWSWVMSTSTPHLWSHRKINAAISQSDAWGLPPDGSRGLRATKPAPRPNTTMQFRPRTRPPSASRELSAWFHVRVSPGQYLTID